MARFPTCSFLVGAFRIKEPDYYYHSFFQDSLECDEIFVQFVQLNEYLRSASKIFQRVPFHFLLFKRNIQNRARLKGFPFNYFSVFWHCGFFSNFFVSKASKFFQNYGNLDVKSGVKRYIRIFDVISELYCVILWRTRRFDNRSFS